MKEGWTHKTLGEVCNIDFGTRVVKSRDAGSIYPVYGGGDATFKMNTYNRDNCMVISRFGMSEQCTRFVKGKFFLNDSGLTLSLKENCMIQAFIDWHILALNDTIYSLGRGAAQKNLDTKALAGIIVSYPESIDEQKNVVARLDAAFTKIDALKANAERQLAEARALFNRALTEEMTPKEGWEEKTFGDVCLYHKEQGVYKDMKYIGMEHMESGTGNILGYMSSNDVLSNSFKFNKGEVLYGRLRPYLRKVYIAEFDGCCSTEVFPIKSEVVESGFIKYWFLTDEITNKINASSAGCRMPRGNMNEVKTYPFYYPKQKKEQLQLVASLDSLSANVRQLEEVQRKTLAECDALKQAMLREVFE